MDGDDVEREERAIYLIAMVVLAPVVVVAMIRHVEFQTGTTICLIGALLGSTGLLASTARGFRKPRLPRARITRRSR